MPAGLRLITQRLIDLLFILFGVSILTFPMIRLIPGDAVQIMLGANAEITPERIEALRAQVGLGTQPPSPSLGLMLVEGRNFLALSPWDSIFSGLAILFAAFGFNFLGDCLRDQLDPRLRD